MPQGKLDCEVRLCPHYGFAHMTIYSAAFAAACGRYRAAGCVSVSRARPCAEQFFAQRALGIRALVSSAAGQFRHQHVGDILEIAGRNGESDVEAVDVGRFEPGLDIVGDLFRRADHDRPGAADADMLDDLAHGPDPVRIGAGDVVHRACGRRRSARGAPAGRDRRSRNRRRSSPTSAPARPRD